MKPAAALAFCLLVVVSGSTGAHEVTDERRLPIIRAAPDFSLTSQNGETVTLGSFRGRTLAVAFIYTSCSDSCPMLTARMARVQKELGSEFGERIAFVSITIDPEHDDPDVLKAFAEAHGADLDGWSFLTGPAASIRDLARQYGVAVLASTAGLDHTFTTSLVDSEGRIRVQYLGIRFDPDEFRRDLLSLSREP